MIDSCIIRKRKMKCEECSCELEVPLAASSRTRIKCVCGTIYEYNPTVEMQPYLVFEDENKQTFNYPLTTSIWLGREDSKDYLIMTNQDDPAIKQNIYVRDIYVSRRHGQINVQEEFFVDGGSPQIVSRRKCILLDCGSTNGTAVNDRLLKPNEEAILKNNDSITLAPNSNYPLTFIFKER